MRKLVYVIASSLDGFIADPHGNDPSGPGGFWPIGEDYVAHLIEHFPETLPGLARDALGVEGPGDWFAPDPAVEVVADDPVATVRAMKGEPGNDIWLVGGGELAGSLSGEIDRIVLKLAPLTLGSGIPLLGSTVDFEPQAWTLVEHAVLASGTIFLTYDRPATN